jgi:intracellular sulfur oxidation DsrE/DsrF family protein
MNNTLKTSHRVVFGFNYDETNYTEDLIRYIKHVNTDFDVNISIAIETIDYGSGIGITIKSSDYANQTIELVKNGVTVNPYHDAIVTKNMTEDLVLDGVAVVNYGLNHLIKRQTDD